MEEKKLWDFIPEFTKAFEERLKQDDLRWGNTWLIKRTRKGQEERIIDNFRDKFDKYLNGGQPIPWLSIIGDAYIAWVRENHPELFPE